MHRNIVTIYTDEELEILIDRAVGKAIQNLPATIAAEIIDRDELCRRLNITEPTVIRYEKKGTIPSIRIGAAVRYNWTEVLKQLESKNRKQNNRC